MVQSLRQLKGYARYFKEAFGSEEITKERVAKAIADYQRTRMSGHSSWDRWQKRRDENAVSTEVKKGHELFFGKAACNQCHSARTSPTTGSTTSASAGPGSRPPPRLSPV